MSLDLQKTEVITFFLEGVQVTARVDAQGRLLTISTGYWGDEDKEAKLRLKAAQMIFRAMVERREAERQAEAARVAQGESEAQATRATQAEAVRENLKTHLSQAERESEARRKTEAEARRRAQKESRRAQRENTAWMDEFFQDVHDAHPEYRAQRLADATHRLIGRHYKLSHTNVAAFDQEKRGRIESAFGLRDKISRGYAQGFINRLGSNDE